MFVMSATRRDRLDNLVAAVRKACRAKPIFLVITSASGCMKERHESNIYATRKACGIPKHPHIRMDPIFAIDVPWPDCKVAADPARLQQQLLEHCARFDFPDLLLHLGAPQMEAPTLLVQVQLTPALEAAICRSRIAAARSSGCMPKLLGNSYDVTDSAGFISGLDTPATLISAAMLSLPIGHICSVAHSHGNVQAAAVEEVLDNVGDANAQSGGKGEQGVNHGKKNGSETQLAHKLVQIGLGGLILGLKAFEITLS
ncbi:hypothetical protein MMC07_002604 [Pseudocyphellaria aurata]|nr:hypothetical protein [Pseudocyphellaria aurata]